MLRPLVLLSTVVLLVVAAATGCGDDELIAPPGDGETFTFSFEDGLEGWRADSADFCELDPETGRCPAEGSFADTEVEVVEGRATEGVRSVRLFGENFTDAVKVWIERAFEADPGVTYDVSVRFDVGTQAFGPGAWQVIGTVFERDPSAAFAADDTTGEEVGDFRILGFAESPSGELAFTRRSFEGTVRAGAGGEVWVGIGVWGTFENANEHFVDAVTIAIEPVE